MEEQENDQKSNEGALPGQSEAMTVRESSAVTSSGDSSVEATRVEGNISVVLQGDQSLDDTRPQSRLEELREQNIAIFYKYIEYENARDYEGLESLFHPTEFRNPTYFGNDPISPSALSRMLRGLFRSFPDWYMVISDLIAADDQGVAALITGRGTQYEEFNGRPAADHQIAIPTIHCIKVRDGLIVEHRHVNPFEDIFKAQALSPLIEDVQAVRAQQGYDSGLAQRLLEEATAAGTSEEALEHLQARVRAGFKQCQTLLKGTLRRCAMEAEPDQLYCEHHLNHGYGVDGIEN